MAYSRYYKHRQIIRFIPTSFHVPNMILKYLPKIYSKLHKHSSIIVGTNYCKPRKWRNNSNFAGAICLPSIIGNSNI